MKPTPTLDEKFNTESQVLIQRLEWLTDEKESLRLLKVQLEKMLALVNALMKRESVQG